MNKVEKSILMVLSTVLLTLSFTSCSKEENDNNKPSEKRLEKLLLKSMSGSSEKSQPMANFMKNSHTMRMEI